MLRSFPALLLLSLLLLLCAAPASGQTTGKQWRKAALSHAKAGRYEEAIEAFEQATTLSPSHGKTWGNYGVALWRQAGLLPAGAGDADALLAQAVVCFDEALERLPAGAKNRASVAASKREVEQLLAGAGGAGGAAVAGGAMATTALAQSSVDEVDEREIDALLKLDTGGSTLNALGRRQDTSAKTIQYFRAAIRQAGGGGTTHWDNLGVAYMRRGMELAQSGSTDEALRFFIRSKRAFDEVRSLSTAGEAVAA